MSLVRSNTGDRPVAAGLFEADDRALIPGAPGATGRTQVMGVLNVTPDSFSDGGRFLDVDAAIAHGLELAAQGADIIDVGGESTKPGADPVSPEEERRRVLPVVEALAAEGLTVSIDTLHADTALAAIGAGAGVVNDVSGGQYDSEMRRTVAETGAAFVVMHWRGVPDLQHRRSSYGDVVTEVREELARLADAAIAAGVAPERLVLDPGFGFDKTSRQGWRLLASLPQLIGLGYPVLIGVSRKRMIAETLTSAGARKAQTPAAARDRPTAEISMEDRDLATAVVSALAAGAGVWGVRVHEVAPTVNALAIAEAWRAGTTDRSGAVVPSSADRGSRSAAGPRTPQDRIELTGLEVFAHHGVFDFERERGQRFLIDVALSLDLQPAAAGDALARTVHYGDLAEAVVAGVERDPVDLIETVAERVAGIALGFPGVAQAEITVHKPDAPIEAEFADVSVTIVRRAPSSSDSAEGENSAGSGFAGSGSTSAGSGTSGEGTR